MAAQDHVIAANNREPDRVAGLGFVDAEPFSFARILLFDFRGGFYAGRHTGNVLYVQFDFASPGLLGQRQLVSQAVIGLRQIHVVANDDAM